MAEEFFERLTPRFQHVARDAHRVVSPLCWAERLYFLAAAGEKHENWRKAYAERYLGEPVPEWGAIISAVIEMWGGAKVDGFAMAALYTLSDNPAWRMAGEAWCLSEGFAADLARFWADPVGHAGMHVSEALATRQQVAV